ncbi:MAG: EpsG family protein [Bacteroidales bacterium]|nr:EpsG family protein [Bacteroidales bacterium]
MNTSISTPSMPSFESNGKYYLVLFILWPFLAFIMAIINYSQKEARKVVYIFLIYYGLSFVIGEVGVDAERYAEGLRYTARMPLSDFFSIFSGLYTDGSVDIVEPLVTFIVSRFTTNHGVLFGVWAALFGFFYLRSINLIHDQYQKNPGWHAQIFMIFFIMIIPITAVSGVRMTIAAWIFFYGAYHAILQRKIWFLVLALSASMMHWSFITANAILLIYYFAGNRNILYVPLLVVSFIAPTLVSPVFQSMALMSGGEIENRYEGYSNEAYIEGIEESYEGASWFLDLSNNLIFYYLIAVLAIIQIFQRRHMQDKSDKNLFSFLLLFLAFVNFGLVIPTFGGRFQLVFYLFATLYVFRYFVKDSVNKLSIITWLGLFPMALYSAVIFRVGMESINVWLFSPVFGVPLLAPALSLGEMLFY